MKFDLTFEKQNDLIPHSQINIKYVYSKYLTFFLTFFSPHTFFFFLFGIERGHFNL